MKLNQKFNPHCSVVYTTTRSAISIIFCDLGKHEKQCYNLALQMAR